MRNDQLLESRALDTDVELPGLQSRVSSSRALEVVTRHDAFLSTCESVTGNKPAPFVFLCDVTMPLYQDIFK